MLLAADVAQPKMPPTYPERVAEFDETGKLSTLVFEMDCYCWTKELTRIEIR